MLDKVRDSDADAAPAEPTGAAATFLSCRDLTKTFGGFTALSNVDLDVTAGEFVCFLGPSGCGKTTLLRAIAGLDPQDSGTISIAGRDVSRLPPAARDFGIVFQSYALFPNLTVFDNVAYGLVNRRTMRAAVEARVGELLALVGLPEQARKYPVQLSGGQQQRVALARALATSPGLLLLDEPLSALDARVRLHLRDEIKSLQRRLGVTTVMVTHDQEEALAIADRIVVMNKGVVEQVGTPEEVYRRPATPFVAGFVGHMNFLAATAAAPGRVRFGEAEFACEARSDMAAGAAVKLAIRPEEVRVRGLDGERENRIASQIVGLDFLGSFCRAELRPAGADGQAIVADFSLNLMRDLDIRHGQSLDVVLPAQYLRVFPG